MSIDFTLPESFARLQAQVRDFVAAQVIPLETDPRQGAHGPRGSAAPRVGRARPLRRTALAPRRG